MDEEEFPHEWPSLQRKRRRSRHKKRRKLPGFLTFLEKNRNKPQAFKIILRSHDKVLFTRDLRITKVKIYDTLHGNREIPRSPTGYIEVQPNRLVNKFKIVGAGSVIHEGERLYFRCPYNKYKVKIWLKRPTIYIWPWLQVEQH